MADPAAAVQTQMKNVQAKTGKTVAELHALLAASGLAKHGEKRALLIERFQLGYGDANMVVNLMAAAPAADDPLDAIYTGAKAPLRPLHEAVMKLIDGLGAHELAPKKGYVSLRRKKQFAMLGPATKDAVELGLNAKNLAPHARLKILPPGGMCQATTRITKLDEVDKTIAGWLRQAYDAAS